MTLRPIDRFERLFTGYAFAAYLLSFLTLVTALMLVMLLVPAGDVGFGAFATDFKTWCFGYDPATGVIDPVYSAVMILNPLMLMAIVGGVWWGQLRDAVRCRRQGLVTAVLLGALSVASLAGGMVLFEPEQPGNSNLPFPAERLRTALPASDFTLQNQDGASVRLADLRGRVVLVTAVYANCHTACPTIITQAKLAISKLPDDLREQLTVVAITLDPENDTQERLAATARQHQLEAPFFNFVNGDDPQVVEDLLDRYSFSRYRNPETDEIEHANMFVLIDTEGLIAFRLNLGDRHQNWLVAALRVLLREATSDERSRQGGPNIP